MYLISIIGMSKPLHKNNDIEYWIVILNNAVLSMKT